MKHLLSIAFLICISSVISAQKSQNPPEDHDMQKELNEKSFHDLKWRNIGPFRGGRSVASCGVIGEESTYYMGSTGGGVWKTTDDGINWKNISDGFFKTGTVGAITVAEQYPNLVLVGMGEHAARGVMTSMGDGVYKSTDAGKTWKHLGLDQSAHISDVIIHPKDANIFYVAVQGAQYGASEDRGVYRSLDAGKSWEKVLYVNEKTGASSLSMDMKNPRILYAAMWEHQRFPWTMQSGGEHSGLYKSVDGGDTWKKMENGLPKNFGKAGISVSRANNQRVFAVIEAETGKGGVYRSDNAGDSWTLVNSERVNIARSWYYMEIFADPQNENIVYVLNAPVMKSIDGGKTFSNLSTPHGDNHHLWINPYNNQKMINSNDGGANISNNGGRSWSSQRNQPTAQFYRVITDDLFPYNVYGGQQDNSAIRIASRTNSSGISWKDWESVAGCESAYLAFDPRNPEIVYGGCYQGIIEQWLSHSKESKSIKEYPELALGNAPIDFKYRFNWNAPIIASHHNPSIIYHAGNVVFKTLDEGMSWEVMSPDLTKNEKEKQGPGGTPITNEAAGGENYNTIMYLTESVHDKALLYAGSDDGLIHITKDGGANWVNITPESMPEGIINYIEISPHNPAKAYAVLMRYKFQDLNPYIYKTENYGEDWTKISDSINDPHTFVRVVKEDPKVPGLLYAGTETGLYVSTDDGQDWEQFQLNLPTVPINDITFRNNDIIVATAGRSFWILDDLNPIQSAIQKTDKLNLLKSRTTPLFLGGQTGPNASVGQNPESGVIIDYFLPEEMDSVELKLEIFRGEKLIRSYSNQLNPDFRSWTGGPSKPKILPSKKGFNRIVWNFRKNNVEAVEKVFVYGDYSGSLVSPGDYIIRLSTDSISVESNVTVSPNPNLEYNKVDYDEQQVFLEEIESFISEIHTAVNQMRSAKNQLEHYKKLLKDKKTAQSLLEQADTLINRINTWESNLVQEKQQTFQDVINFNNQLNAELMNLKSYVDSPIPKLTKGAKERLNDLKLEWNGFRKELNAIVNLEMEKFNEMYIALELPAIIIKN